MVNKTTTEILKEYTVGTKKRYLYRDKIYDDRGIDYTHFLKIRLTTFDNSNHFIEQFTPEGYQILWFLMTRAKNNTYITTTLNTIIHMLKMSRHKVIKGVNALIQSNIINVFSVKENYIKTIKDINLPIHIIIKYQNEDIYDLDNMRGYRPIPYDFVYKMVTDLDEKEFTIYMYLMTRNRYYQVKEVVDEVTGELKYYVNNVGYAFPTLEQIATQIRCERRNVNKYIDSLEKKEYIKVNRTLYKDSKKDKETGKQIIKNINNTYEIKLLNRLEYIKHQIINVANEEISKLSKDLQKYIKTTEADKILIEHNNDNIISKTIKEKLYLGNRYGKQLNEYQFEY